METKRYKTKQRSALLDFFASHSDKTFSASELIADPALGLGEATVYRQLSKLSEEGKLNKIISNASDGARYQYHPHESCNGHFHLRCTKCGELVCAECSFMENMEKHLGADHGFTVDPKKTVIYGICKECKGN